MDSTFNINKNTSTSILDNKLSKNITNTLSNKEDICSFKKVDMSFLSDYILSENQKENEKITSEYFILIFSLI